MDNKGAKKRLNLAFYLNGLPPLCYKYILQLSHRRCAANLTC
jgi:hypothetical protein